MKGMSMTFLAGVVVLSFVSSCVTVPTEPLAPGGLRLLSMKVPESGNIRINFPFEVDVLFEGAGEAEIRRVCFYWSGDGPYCFPVSNVRSGSPGSFKSQLRAFNSGSFTLECFAEYVEDGKIKRTNRVSSQIFVVKN